MNHLPGRNLKHWKELSKGLKYIVPAYSRIYIHSRCHRRSSAKAEACGDKVVCGITRLSFRRRRVENFRALD